MALPYGFGEGTTPGPNFFKQLQANFAALQVSSSWTPVLSFGGSTVGITYAIDTGRVLKVGSLVIFDFRVALTSKGVQVGDANMAGLPYAAGPQGGYVGIARYANMAGIVSFSGIVNSNIANIQFDNGGAINTSIMTDANFTDTSDIIAVGTFLTP